MAKTATTARFVNQWGGTVVIDPTQTAAIEELREVYVAEMNWHNTIIYLRSGVHFKVREGVKDVTEAIFGKTS